MKSQEPIKVGSNPRQCSVCVMQSPFDCSCCTYGNCFPFFVHGMGRELRLC